LYLEGASQPAERAMLHHAHRPRPLTDDPRYLDRAEIAENAQQYHFRLVPRKRRPDQIERPIRAERRERLFFGVTDTPSLREKSWRHWLDALAGASTTKVRDSTSGNRERPCAERLLVASESHQTTGYVKPRI
jgi:hypothetical protein